MAYKQVKSQFIKDKIKGLKWNEENKEYIENLMLLEKGITENIRQWAFGMHFHQLKSKYNKEYEAIYKELKPKEFEKIKKREVKERKKEEEKDKKSEEEERREEERTRKEWLEMGGK